MSGTDLAGKRFHLKSMNKMIEHAQEMREAFDLEAEGSKAEEPRHRAQWAEFLAAEIRKQGMAKSKEVTQAMGKLSRDTPESSFMTLDRARFRSC